MPSIRTTTRRRAAVAAGSVLALTALAACNGGDGDGDSTLADVQESGSITVAFNGEVPYSYEDADGELTGAAIALNEQVYSQLGVDEIDGVLTDWDSLIPSLTAGRVDSVSAGMSILPERCEQAAFSEPEIMYTTAFLVPEGNPDGLSDWQSVEGTDLTLAVMAGAIESGYAADTGVSTLEVGAPQDGLDAVVAGRADAFALTGISLRALADASTAPVEATEAFVAVIDGVPQIGAGSTVFRLGDTDLVDAYNEHAQAIISDPAAYESVLGPFGFTEAERPPAGLTAEMLCEGDLEAIADELDM